VLHKRTAFLLALLLLASGFVYIREHGVSYCSVGGQQANGYGRRHQGKAKIGELLIGS